MNSATSTQISTVPQMKTPGLETIQVPTSVIQLTPPMWPTVVKNGPRP